MKIAMRMRALIVAMMLLTVPAQAVELTGVPIVADGDTLVIGAVKVRLEGIDAPETDQSCLGATGFRWTCGIEARDRLAAHVASRKVSCTTSDTDAYGRTLATCRIAHEDLNRWMVQEGWALAYAKYSSAYLHSEEDARTHKRGLWQGAFIAPWDWRHRSSTTAILGAYNVPMNAQKLLLPTSASVGAPSPDCIIKGNVNRTGERIYHLPNQHSKIRMDIGGGRRWFCTPMEAEAAGWRKAFWWMPVILGRRGECSENHLFCAPNTDWSLRG